MFLRVERFDQANAKPWCRCEILYALAYEPRLNESSEGYQEARLSCRDAVLDCLCVEQKNKKSSERVLASLTPVAELRRRLMACKSSTDSLTHRSPSAGAQSLHESVCLTGCVT